MNTEQPEQPTDETPKPKRRGPGKPFTKNDPRLRQNMEADAPSADGEDEVLCPPESEDGAPQQLLDMRHVYARPPMDDRTPGQRMCRKWMKADVKTFMRHKCQLEEKYLLARAAARKDNDPPADSPEQHDDGTERSLHLIDRILNDAASQVSEADRVGNRVGRAWAGLSLKDQQTILAIVERESNKVRVK